MPLNERKIYTVGLANITKDKPTPKVPDFVAGFTYDEVLAKNIVDMLNSVLRIAKFDGDCVAMVGTGREVSF